MQFYHATGHKLLNIANRRKNDAMVTILKSTKDYLCITGDMPQQKTAQFSVKMHASQPGGQRAWILTIFYTQVLG